MVSTPTRKPQVGDRISYLGKEGWITQIEGKVCPVQVTFTDSKIQQFSHGEIVRWCHVTPLSRQLAAIKNWAEYHELASRFGDEAIDLASEELSDEEHEQFSRIVLSVSPKLPNFRQEDICVGDYVKSRLGVTEGVVTKVDNLLVFLSNGRILHANDCELHLKNDIHALPVKTYSIGDRVSDGTQQGTVRRIVPYTVETFYDVIWDDESQGSYPQSQLNKNDIQLPTEKELTPINESAIGKHYWLDQNTVVVTVLSCQYWKKNSKGKPVAIGRVRPWWTHEQGERVHPDQFAIEFDQLVEIEELSCPNPKFLETSGSVQVGSLYQYTSNKMDKKTGAIRTFPPVEGERQRDNDAHWYWGFSYIEKSLGKRRDRSAAVPRNKLGEVRAAIRDRRPHTYILQFILGKD